MRTIYAGFERVENAKAAVGRIKKESWNQADFTVIFPEPPLAKIDDNHFEFGDEHFLDSSLLPKAPQWPALQDHEIEGIGKIKMAASFKPVFGPELREDSLMMNQELIADGLKKNRVMTIIEADEELVSKIETILESEGAEFTIFGEKREELQG